LWILLAIAGVVIVVLSAVVLTQMKSKKSESSASSAASTSSAAQAAPPQHPSGTQPPQTNSANPSMTCEGFTASIDPGSHPGWHATINHLGLGYAVPQDWNVGACDVRMGWAQPCPAGRCVIREIAAVASVANPACPKQNLAMAGVMGSKNPDIRAALDEESKVVPAMYTQNGQVPNVDFTPVREFTIGTHPAVQMIGTVTGMMPDSCNGSSAIHSIVVTTVPKVEGSVVFVLSLRQGATVTANPDVIDKIVATLRSPA
jgi:hypothetical protein